MSALEKGSKAPDFRLPLMSGGEFSLSEVSKKSAVVLVFFKISCPVCQYGAPYFDRLAERLKAHGVTVVGISQDDRDATASFMKSYGMKMPVALDARPYRVSAAYGLTNVPTMFEVAQNGVIAMSSVGWAKEDVEAVYARHAGSAASSSPLFPAEETVAAFRAG